MDTSIVTVINDGGIPCKDVDLCMIVCDEITVIDRSISALLDAGFDSFIVLDMESADGTTERIHALAGNKVTIHSYPRRSLLKFGYAEARNVCAAFAKREWVLFVDADEVLVGGCGAAMIRLASGAATSDLFSIGRKNLEHEGRIADLHERHNRLYRPSFTQRWIGYIHEEIHRNGISGGDAAGKSALAFDHYAALKPVVAVEARTDLHATLLLRAYNQPALRVGTDPWWYDTYVVEHLATLERRATFFAQQTDLDPALFDKERPMVVGPSFRNDSVIRAVSSADAEESTFDLTVLRTLHSVSSKPWTNTSERVLWGEWNHRYETSRSLASIIASTQLLNWHRFIKPGMVCVDIGGHSGDTAIPMALFSFDASARRRGRVVVVEPNPAVIPVLDVNLAMNTHIGDYFVVNAAITDDDMAEIELADFGNAGCNGGVLSSGLSAELADKLQTVAGTRYKTRGVSMATLLEQINRTVSPDPVGFIKLDCEGYDKEILKPCRDLFKRDKPVLFVEWFAWFAPEDDADLFTAIESIGYVPLDPATLQPARPELRISDLLCIHAEAPL